MNAVELLIIVIFKLPFYSMQSITTVHDIVAIYVVAIFILNYDIIIKIIIYVISSIILL